MAEYASAIVGLVQVAETVVLQVYHYIKTVKNAGEEVRQLSTRLTELVGIVHGLKLAVQELDAQSTDHVLQFEHVAAFKMTITDLHLKLSGFRPCEQPGEPSAKTKKRWKWPFSKPEIEELNVKLEAHKTALSLSLAADSLCAILQLSKSQEIVRRDLSHIQEKLEAQTRIALTRENESILQRLNPLTPLHHHKMNKRLRQAGTGEWFVQSSEFQTWLATQNAKLWVYGIPGAGKSILMAYVIGKILSLEETQTTNSAVAYFYCDYKDGRTQTPQAVLGSLAQQIARQDKRSFEKLETFIKKNSADKQSATLSYDSEDLCHLIVDMATNFETVSLVVDGLDECEGLVREVTFHVAGLVKQSVQIKMILSSRDIVDIRERVDDYEHMSIAARNSDLVLYVAEEIGKRMEPKSLRPLRIRDLALKVEIQDTLVTKAQGMFRWVALQLDYICGLPTDRAIREALGSLPPDLFSSYERLLVQLNKKHQSVRDMVQRALKWILGAKGFRISTDGICDAVSIKPGMQRWDPDAVPDKVEILRNCGSFIRESVDGGYFESAHFTVQEFFIAIDSTRHPEFAPYRLDERDAERYFAETALTYLCLDDLEDTRPTATFTDSGETLQTFRRVVEQEWYTWSRELLDDPAILGLVKQLFSQQDCRNLRIWGVSFFNGQICDLDLEEEYPLEWIRQTFDCLSPLHLAAMLDMPELCQWLIEQGCSTNSLSPFGSPLYCAILGTRGPVFWSLTAHVPSLNASALQDIIHSDDKIFIFFDACNKSKGRNLLGLKKTLQYLISSGANVNERRTFAGQTDTPPSLLGLAALMAHNSNEGLGFSIESLDIISTLVDAGAAFRKADCLTPLLRILDDELDFLDNSESHAASTGGLLQKLTKVNLENHQRASLEQLLHEWSHLEPGADRTKQSNRPVSRPMMTPEESQRWFHAAKNDFSGVVKRFLATKIRDVDVRDENGFSALALAAKHSSIDLVKLLVGHGADINSVSSTGSTPLLEALSANDHNVARFLLGLGADYTSEDCKGQNVWHYASKSRSIKPLLELSSVPGNVRALADVKDSSGKTPLICAAKWGPSESFFLLLDFQVDEWVTDHRGRTLLHFAAMGANTKVVESLIERRHSVLDQDNDGYNALLHAASKTLWSPSRMQCLRVLYEADSTCALAKTNEGLFVEDLILNNFIFMRAEIYSRDSWNEIQSIFMRNPRLSIEKIILEIEQRHQIRAGQQITREPWWLQNLWSNLNITFQGLLRDYLDNISPLLGTVLSVLLTVYIDQGEDPYAKDTTLVDLLCSIIDVMTSTQLENVRVNKRRVLCFALSYGVPRMVSRLVAKNLDVDARDEDVLSDNAVQLACYYACDLAAFDNILESSKDLSIKTMDGRGLLHLASTTNSVAKVDRLILAGLDVNAPDAFGQTPLYFATRHNQPSIVKFLLTHGADPSRKNVHGRSPVHCAANTGCCEALRQLSAQKAGLDQTHSRYNSKTGLVSKESRLRAILVLFTWRPQRTV
jgi:ankyrin repeat protein